MKQTPRLLRLLPLLIICGAVFSAVGAPQTPARPPVKKLMEYGWDMPTPDQLRANQAALDASPFDGLTLKLSAGQEIFRVEAFAEGTVQQDVGTLKAIKSAKLRHSYLSVLAGSGAGWDWTNDAHWAATERSLRLLAGAARAAGLRGLTFDLEPYTLNPWDYAAQPAAKTHDFAQLQAKVRARGRAFMRAAQTEYPGVQIYMLYLLTANTYDLEGPASELGTRLKASDYGLWPAFVNGLLDAAAPTTSLVEGNEPAYYYLHAAEFDATRGFVKKTMLPLVAAENRAKYAHQVQLGQSVFADGVMNLLKSPRFCGYYFGSDAERGGLLQHNVYHALRTSDETAWFYNEKIDWWGKAGQPAPSPMLVRAIAEARRAWQAGALLNVDLRSTATAETACNAKVSVGGDLNSNTGLTLVQFEVNGVVAPAGSDPNCATWNANKQYSCVFPGGWTGTVRPVADGLKFDPPIRSYNKLAKDDWQAHFTADR